MNRGSWGVLVVAVLLVVSGGLCSVVARGSPHQEILEGPLPWHPSATIQKIRAVVYDAEGSGIVGEIILEREVGVFPYVQIVRFIEAGGFDHAEVFWDLDPLIDSDGDKEPTNDRDVEGTFFSVLRFSADRALLSLNLLEGDSITQWMITVPENFTNVCQLVIVELRRVGGLRSLPAERWAVEQQHMTALDMEYMTEFSAVVVSEATGFQITTPSPGRYVLRLTNGSMTRDFVIWAYQDVPLGRSLWLFMSDIWNNVGNPWDPVDPHGRVPFFTDEQVVEKIRYLHAHHIVNIGFAQNLRYASLDPITFERWNHSLPDEDLHWLLELLTEPEGARVIVQLQTIIEPGWAVDVDELRDHGRLRRQLDEWFGRLFEQVSELARILADHGGGYLNIFGTAPLTWLGEMPPDIKDKMSSRWASITALLSREYAVRVGLSDYHIHGGLGNNLTYSMLRASDWYWILVFNNPFCHSAVCTVQEVESTMGRLLSSMSGYALITSSAEPFFVVNPKSNTQALHGQLGPALGGTYAAVPAVDFRAQVLALEGTLSSFLRSAAFRSAVVSPEYWKMLDYEAPYLTWMERQVMIDASLQGKPAFWVFYLWNLMINRPEIIENPVLAVRHLEQREPVVIKVRARGGEFMGWPIMLVTVNGTEQTYVEVASHEWLTYELPVQVDGGIRSVCVEFPNDLWSEGEGHRHLFVDWLEVAGHRVQVENLQHAAGRYGVTLGPHYIEFWGHGRICIELGARE